MATCTVCGTETPDGARFCQNCGAALLATHESAETTPLMVPPAVTPPTYAPHPTLPYSYPPTPPQPGVMYPAPPYSLVPGQPFIPARNGKAIAGMWLGIASIFPGIFLNWPKVSEGVTRGKVSRYGSPRMRPKIFGEGADPCNERVGSDRRCAGHR